MRQLGTWVSCDRGQSSEADMELIGAFRSRGAVIVISEADKFYCYRSIDFAHDI